MHPYPKKKDSAEQVYVLSRLPSPINLAIGELFSC